MPSNPFKAIRSALQGSAIERGAIALGKTLEAFGEKHIEPRMPGPFLRDSSIMEGASTENLLRMRELYSDVIGLGADVDFSSTALSDYVKNKPKDFTAFSALKDELAQHSPTIQNHVDTVKNSLHNALNPEESFDTALINYEKALVKFKEKTKKVPSELHAQAVVRELKETQDAARSAIVTQQEKELTNITNLFRARTFALAMQKAKNIPDAELTYRLNALKENMLTELKNTHKSQLETFDKSTAESMKKIHNAARIAWEEQAFIANLEKNGTNAVKARIKEARAKHLELVANSVAAGVVQNEEDSPSLSMEGITLKALGNLELKSGLTLIRLDDASYKIQLPGYILGLPIYASYSKKIEASLLQMAQLAKLSGKDEVKSTLSGFEDPELAKVRARQAYEANIHAGWKPEQIIIEINGQVHRQNPNKEKGEKPFVGEKDSPFAGWSVYGALNSQSQRIVKNIEKSQERFLSDKITPESQASSLKTKLAETKGVPTPTPSSAPGPAPSSSSSSSSPSPFS